jgi:DNA-binding HxlR family transcriptional regulator
MLKRTYDGQVCSIARTLETVGERWTLLILRDAFLGVRRFDDFQRSLGVARNVLSDRLERLVDAGVLERRPYQERPPRYEYRLTDKGRDLFPVIFGLMRWGDKHAAPDGPPRIMLHRDCGGSIDDHRVCTKCGQALEARDVEARPGPAALTA